MLKRALLLPLRAAVFVVGFSAYWMEVAADWLVGARGRTEYVRVGRCKQCGRCCQCLALIMPEGISRRSWMVRLASLWHGAAMNFHFLAEERGWLVYRCDYYDDARGCTRYRFRHRLCRFFPRQRLYGHPSVHPDCGFSFVRRDVLERRTAARTEGRPEFSALLEERRRAPAPKLPLSSPRENARSAPFKETRR